MYDDKPGSALTVPTTHKAGPQPGLAQRQNHDNKHRPLAKRGQGSKRAEPVQPCEEGETAGMSLSWAVTIFRGSQELPDPNPEPRLPSPRPDPFLKHSPQGCGATLVP